MQDLMGPPQHLASSSSHDMMQLSSFRAVRGPRGDAARQIWRRTESSQKDLRDAVKQTLTLIYDKGEEVPLIGLYRKEMVG